MTDKEFYTQYMATLVTNLMIQPHHYLVQEGNVWYFNPIKDDAEDFNDVSLKYLTPEHPEFQKMRQALLSDLLNPDISTHQYQYYFGRNNRLKSFFNLNPSDKQLSHLYRTLGCNENWQYRILDELASKGLNQSYQQFFTEKLSFIQMSYKEGQFEKTEISPLTVLVHRINHLTWYQANRQKDQRTIVGQDVVLNMLTGLMANNVHLLEKFNVFAFMFITAVKKVLDEEHVPLFFNHIESLTGKAVSPQLCQMVPLVTHTIEINTDYLTLHYPVETPSNLVNVFSVMEKAFRLPELKDLLGLHNVNLVQDVTESKQNFYVQIRQAHELDYSAFSHLINEFIDTAMQFPLNSYPENNEKIMALFLKKVLHFKLDNQLPVNEEVKNQSRSLKI